MGAEGARQGPEWAGAGTEGWGREEGGEFAVPPAGQAPSESGLWEPEPPGQAEESVHRTALASGCSAETPDSCLCS